VVDDCFDRVGLDRLVAMTTADNASSLRALEKIGMSYVGKRRRDRPGSGVAYQLFELRSVDRRRT
jgi:RimJ/RimL family protein N-acetyltransferase